MEVKRLLFVLLFAWPAYAAAPGWITSCAWSHASNDDPIVYPGLPGRAHLHDFTGAKTAGAFSTPNSLEAGGTTCAMPADTSAYWIPRLFYRGISLPPKGQGAKNALFYYRRQGSSLRFQTIPRGLKMIVGNANATSAVGNADLAAGRIIFKCGPGSGTDLPQPPAQCGSGLMVVSLKFPNCWNGRDLDSPDHKAHMKYPPCTSTHPVPIPRIESFWRYQVGTAPIGTVQFAGEGGPRPYYTIHQDFFNAWNVTDLQSLMNRCINGGVDCGTNPVP